MRRLVDELGMQISFPVEVRVVAPDDIPLSTADGRATGYIAVHVYRGTPYDAYFQGVEAIMNSYGGRPHWGKMHFQRAETLAERYPRWDDFQAVRRRLDPDGGFTNPYLDRVLGPVGDLTTTAATIKRTHGRACRMRSATSRSTHRRGAPGCGRSSPDPARPDTDRASGSGTTAGRVAEAADRPLACSDATCTGGWPATTPARR